MKSKKKILAIILLVAAIIVALPIVVGCGYTYLAEDDFSFENGAIDELFEQPSDSLFVAAMVRTVKYYFSNQGTFFGNFMVHYVLPYYRMGLQGTPVVMFIVLIAFCIGLYVFIRSIFKDELATAAFFFATMISMFLLSDTNPGKELFYWYTGAMFYTIELTLSFFAVSLCIKAKELENKGKIAACIIVSAVFGFFASGGILQPTAVHCAFMFIMMLVWNKKVLEKRYLDIPPLMSLIGAIFNVAGPGNYIRSEGGMTEGHSTIFDAFRDAIVCYRREIGHILSNPVFWILIAFVFVIAICCEVKVMEDGMSAVWLVIFFAAMVFSQFITTFPVNYGYHGDSLSSMRTSYTFVFVSRMLFMFWTICLAQFVREHVSGLKYVFAAVLVLFAVVFSLVSGRVVSEVKGSFSYITARDFKNGRLQECYATRSYVLRQLEFAEKGSDVIIYVPIKMADCTYGMGLTEDPGSFVNTTVAYMYDVHSVTVFYDYLD